MIQIKKECESIRTRLPKLKDFTDDEIISFEEIAGTYEFEHNMFRFKAEERAFSRIMKKRS